MGDIFSLIFGKIKRLEIGINVSEAIRRNSTGTKEELVIDIKEAMKNRIPIIQLVIFAIFFMKIPFF
jgi:hypothetical protein